jgi:hypothetical protein
MNIHAEKSPENKDRPEAGEVSPRRSGGDVAFQAPDNRPQAIAQRNLQEMANQSPRVKQLAALQDAANNSPQVKRSEALQEQAGNSPAFNRTIQRKIKIIDDKHTKPDPDHPGQTIPDPNPSLDWHIVYFDYIYPKVKHLVTPDGPENKIINDILKKYDADNVTFASPAELLKALIQDLKKVLSNWGDDGSTGQKEGQKEGQKQDLKQDLKQDMKSDPKKDEKEQANNQKKDQKDEKEGLAKVQGDKKEKEGNNIQALLTNALWEKELTAIGANLYQKTQVSGYWENYAPKNEVAVPPRKISDIVATVGPALLEDLKAAGKKAPDQRLKLYRTMDKPEAAAIIAWSKGGKAAAEALMGSQVPIKELNAVLKDKANPAAMPIVGHLGGREQSETFFERGRNVMLEFTLKPGAQLVLFNPKYMALARSGKEVTSLVAEYEKATTGRIFPEATGNEGNLPGYVGMKSEKRGDFSLTMGKSDATHLLFQLLIESVKEV